MKFKTALLTSLLTGFVLLISGCGSIERFNTEMDIASDRLDTGLGNSFNRITSTHRDYKFLQETGGILVRAPQLQADGSYFLPVIVDVSGASNITRTPVKYNAEIAVKQIGYSADKTTPNRLFIYIETCWPSENSPSPVAKGLNIGKLATGSYTVEYLNSDRSTVMIGGFQIAK